VIFGEKIYENQKNKSSREKNSKIGVKTTKKVLKNCSSTFKKVFFKK